MATIRASTAILTTIRKGGLGYRGGASVNATLTRAFSSATFARPLSSSLLSNKPLLTRFDIPLSDFNCSFSTTAAALHGDWKPPAAGSELYITFIDKELDEHKIAVSEGDNLLTVAQYHDIPMEGACEGSCACSTCHVIVEDEAMYNKLPEPTDDENDMLDLAFGLTETSRLGCQVVMKKEWDGLRVRLPNATRNLQASNFK